jgi:hypothetical protein
MVNIRHFLFMIPTWERLAKDLRKTFVSLSARPKLPCFRPTEVPPFPSARSATISARPKRQHFGPTEAPVFPSDRSSRVSRRPKLPLSRRPTNHLQPPPPTSSHLHPPPATSSHLQPPPFILFENALYKKTQQHRGILEYTKHPATRLLSFWLWTALFLLDFSNVIKPS